MKRFLVIFTMICVFICCTGAAFASVTIDDPLENLETPAESSNWERTTSSQEVLDYLVDLIPLGNGKLRLEYIARTVQGRLQPLLVIGNPAPKDPSEVPSDKAVVLVNCNIHSGEVEGKEAMLIFVREVAQGKHDDLLKDLVILLNPNMNADGNDNLAKWRRNSQFTPKLMGTRDDGQGYNINRDMTKLDAYEARAMVEVMNKWDPVIFIDAHATNGSYMRHAVTYNWGLHPNTDLDIMVYNRGEFSRKSVGRESYLYKELGRVAIPYGNFSGNRPYYIRPSTDPHFPGEPYGWQTFEDYPRYTTNYAGLRNRLAILLEVYSYDDFQKRVETQYACIYGILQTVAADKVKIKDLIAQADKRSLDRAVNGVSEVVTLDSYIEPLRGLSGNDRVDEIDEDGYVTVQSYATSNDATTSAATISPTFETAVDGDGDPYAYRVKANYPPDKDYKVLYYGNFVPTNSSPMGALYVIRPGGDSAVELLLRHGIEVKKLTQDVAVDNFQWYKIDTMNPNTSLYEGHRQNRTSGDWEVSSDLTIPSGSFVVSTAQKNGSLAALLLEPECVDGAIAWNFLDNLIFNESTGTSLSSERFRTRDPNTTNNQWVVMPIFKFDNFDAIPASATEVLAALPHDETLPPPVEYDGETADDDADSKKSSGCDVGFGIIGIGVLMAAAFTLRKKA